MIRRIAEKCKENKKLCLLCLIGVIAVIAVIVLIATFHVKWQKGGTDTKGPFRYGRHHNGRYEIRIDTTNLPDGTFSLWNDGGDALETTDKGKKGKEQVYVLERTKGSNLATWSVVLHADEQAKEKQEYLYFLQITFGNDADGKIQVIQAEARDYAPVKSFTKDDYGISYQLQNVSTVSGDNRQGVYVTIENALSDNWEIEYDKKLVTATDFYYNLDEASITIQPADKQTDAFETDVTLYTVSMRDGKKSRGTEITFHVKGQNGSITEVTHEQK